ncbi:MAG: hypothetical protein HZB16_19685 [Armatimonadetes bacterium]|nr:hypothetical protein [Armatimonadota bacterium]
MALALGRRRFGSRPTRPPVVVPLLALALLVLLPVSLVAVPLPLVVLLPTQDGQPWAASRAWASLAILPGAGLGLLLMPLGWLLLAALYGTASGLRLVPRVAAAASCAAAAAFVAVGTWAVLSSVDEARMAGFERAAGRARPLVEALRAYHRDHGQSAPSLAALVPRYLPAVPGTGLVGYPQWRYEPANSVVERWQLDDGNVLELYEDGGWPLWSRITPGPAWVASGRRPLKRAFADCWRHDPSWHATHTCRLGLPPADAEAPPAEGAWRLVVDCTLGLGFDQFYYLPTERYPRYAHGGEIERAGRWAYVHE